MKFLDFVNESLDDLVVALEERISKMKYYWPHTKNICGEDKKMIGIVFILAQEALFGYKGLSAEELYNFSEVGMTKTRNTLKYLDEKNLIKKTRDGKKILYNIDLDAMKNY